MSNNSGCGCESGYARVSDTPSTNGSVITTTTTTTSTTQAVAKVTEANEKLLVTDFCGYEPKVAQVDATTTKSTSCGGRKMKPCAPLKFLPDHLNGGVCSDTISLVGYDGDGALAKFCDNDGKYIVGVGEGKWQATDEIPMQATCLLHETVTVESGAVLLGEPICGEHFVLSDVNGKLWSQKPKDGHVLVGEDGKACQKDVRDLGSCHKGALSQTDNGIEIVGYQSGDTVDPEAYRCLETLKMDDDCALLILKRVEDDAYGDGCGDGYKVVASPVNLEDLADLLRPLI